MELLEIFPSDVATYGKLKMYKNANNVTITINNYAKENHDWYNCLFFTGSEIKLDQGPKKCVDFI